MKHLHKFKDYKEIDVPNGKYMVTNNTKLKPEDIEYGFIDSTVEAMTEPCLILYCQSCGDVIIKRLALSKGIE